MQLPSYRTPFVKPKSLSRPWVLIDASGIPLGRLASRIAYILRGKHLPYFAPQWNLGPSVVVINAEKFILTGKKAIQKTYIYHTGYPGGQREIPLRYLSPEKILRHAVKGMLPKNKLQARMLRNLHIYTGPSHPHAAQKPQIIKVL